jgi:hypothetical protein
MRIEKRNSLAANFLGILFLCASGVFADYIEGIDTTDVNGYGLDSAFQMTNGYVNGQNIVVYHMDGYMNGYFNYSFDDIKMARDSIDCISQHDQSGACTLCVHSISNQYINNYCFVIKKIKDSTYSKIQIINRLANNRYVFKYGTNTQPNNRMLEKTLYDRSIRYKPNNFNNISSYYSCDGYDFPGIHYCSWDPPLPNNNHLLGYMYYHAKPGIIIDTTAPINLTQWDSLPFTTMTNGNFVEDVPECINLVAVYAEGKSDFLQGWFKPTIFPVGIKSSTNQTEKLQSNFKIRKAPNGFYFTLEAFPQTSGSSSLSIFNMTGTKVAEFTGIKSNQVFWKTSGRNLAQGQYIVQLGLPDKRVFSSRLVYSR